MTRIAIIGAGLAGLACADMLRQRGSNLSDLAIFEKSRGIGGRMATRYIGDYEFDHGAQYFTTGTDRFANRMESFLEAGTVARWPVEIATIGGASARKTDRYVSAPRMNTLCKALADPFEVKLQTRILSVNRENNAWYLADEENIAYGPFDYVVSAMPAPQMLDVLPGAFANVGAALAVVRMAACYALMLGFSRDMPLPWQAVRVGGSPVGWIATNSNKPGRETATSVLVQSSNDWAEDHLEDDPDKVQAILLQTASEISATDLSAAEHIALHRWRYAATPQPLGVPFLLDETAGLAACGDWCLGSRVAAAFESGAALGDAIAAEIQKQR